MTKSRFTETQIVAILQEAHAGLKVAEVCRKHGISQPTLYNWESKCGGLGVAELRQINELEADHAKLKRMYADLAMESKRRGDRHSAGVPGGRAASKSRPQGADRKKALRSVERVEALH